MSLIITLVVICYGLTKSTHLQSVRGATISTYEEKANSSPDNGLNINDRNLRFAFAFEGYLDRKIKNDPRYVKWIFRQSYKKDNKWSERILPYHECTEQDYAEFYPIQSY